MEKPTISPSILVEYSHDPRIEGVSPRMKFICHSFVKEGMIQFLSDCNHDLAGQIVALPDFDSTVKAAP
jgi:hypothetical protein